jgi:microcystin-dependent protein
MICDGSAISRSTYAVLFARLGVAFGAGDEVTTFNLPNLKGRVAVGVDTAQTEFDTVGETGGENTHALVAAENGIHTHIQNAHNHAGTADEAGATAGGANNYGYGSGGAGMVASISGAVTQGNYNHSHNLTIGNKTASNQNSGSGQAHNNLQPYIGLHYIIKVN